MLIFGTTSATTATAKPVVSSTTVPRQTSASALRSPRRPEVSARAQQGVVGLALAIAFLAVGAQLVRLVIKNEATSSAAMIEPVSIGFSRPDIVDRNGRLLATDVEVNSLFADPARVLDKDEVVEKLSQILPDLDEADLLKSLSETTRRFVWIKRGLSPKIAQRIHDLGLPGLSFRRELRRAYPLGALAGHVIGHVSADNKGVSGIERHIDETIGIDAVQAALPTERPPVSLSLDIGVQASLEAELAASVARYNAAGASAMVMDIVTGEVVAAASLPQMEPARLADALDLTKKDRLQGGTYELGSIFKLMTIAMAIDRGQVTPASILDVRTPLTAGRFTISDLHPLGRPMSVSEVFVHSSNVGSGMMALEAGSTAQREFLTRAGLLGTMKTEAGPVAAPQIPTHWDRTETITISYGHGLAISPLQFAAAAGALFNGGTAIQPTYVRRMPGATSTQGERIVSAETSAAMRGLMRLNVTDAQGTGRRADVPGVEVGGKTGTADIPGPRGYKKGGVISSFLAAFPMSAPRYVAIVSLFEPKPTAETGGKVLAGLTAAPTAGRLIARIAPQLDGVANRNRLSSAQAFDAASRAP
jgi:cell division protein FtsI (penicillin-binding protein 3)